MTTHRPMTAILALLLAVLALSPATIGQDPRDPAAPTAAITLVDVGQTEINSYISSGYRLTDLEYRSGQGSSTRFDVTMIANSGTFQTAWWWYFGVTTSQITSFINSNQGRLIDIESYVDSGGTRRFCCIMVANTGSNAKTWWWYVDTSLTTINFAVLTNTGRIVDIERYSVGGTTYYAAIMISNTGADQQTWWRYHDVTQAQITGYINTNQARIYDLERRSTGTYDVVMVANPSTYWYWWTGVTASQLEYLLTNTGVRVIDIERYTTFFGSRYAVATLNNVNALTTDVGNAMRATTNGQVGCWLERVNGTNLASLNGTTVFEPASTMKTLHHAHAMRQVYLGNSQLNSLLTVYSGYSTSSASCPVDTGPFAEGLQTVLQLMMENSDNARTQAVTAYYGQSAINTTASPLLAMNQTSLNHRLGCPAAMTNPNETSLRDLHRLHEAVANGWLGGYRETFYTLMQDDVTDLGIAGIVNTEGAALGLSSQTIASFLSFTRVAHKGGNYILTPAGGTTSYERAEFGFIRLPFFSGGNLAPREYTFGAFVNDADNDTEAADAIYVHAIPTMLRDRIVAALQTWTNNLAATQTIGAGCGSPTFTQTATTLPRLGTTMTYNGANGYPIAITAFAMGLSSTTWNGLPLPLPVTFLGAESGCFAYNDVATAELTVSSGTGASSFNFAIPNSANLVGFEYLTQLWSFSPTSLKLSNGIRTIVGL